MCVLRLAGKDLRGPCLLIDPIRSWLKIYVRKPFFHAGPRPGYDVSINEESFSSVTSPSVKPNTSHDPICEHRSKYHRRATTTPTSIGSTLAENSMLNSPASVPNDQ